MKKIHQLPPHIIAKIAAGEIIERPAYAVKELLDNAIDAGANNLEIEIEQSGFKKIKVTDNGVGMSKEDLQECFKTHTTSKIFNEYDLAAIKTLGFRGEALASLTAVANLTIYTKTKNSIGGSKIEIISNHPSKITSIGMPVGTVVTVTNLFSKIPVRKKFLKTKQTEFRYITDIITSFALSYPHLKILFTHEKRTILNLPKNQTMEDRIRTIFDSSLLQNLIPLSYSDQYINIHGFISHPQIATKSLQKQFLFVNQRRISDKTLSSIIKSSYGNLLDNPSNPIVILYLSLPFEIVDVNIHPRKEQVSFADDSLVYHTVEKAITQTLSQKNLIFTDLSSGLLMDESSITNSYLGKILKEESADWDTSNLGQISQNTEIQQIHNLYLLTQSKLGLVIIDQHAAHERILYEQLKTEFINQKSKNLIYKLPKPLILDLSLSEAAIIHENMELFKNIGFEIEYFKNNSFIIRNIPYLFKDRNIKQLITEILEQILEDKNIKDIDDISNKIIAYIACRTAVKAGDSLTRKQMKNLINKLEAIPNNATCPHGRPTKIELGLGKLNKSFKRG